MIFYSNLLKFTQIYSKIRKLSTFSVKNGRYWQRTSSVYALVPHVVSGGPAASQNRARAGISDFFDDFRAISAKNGRIGPKLGENVHFLQNRSQR